MKRFVPFGVLILGLLVAACMTVKTTQPGAIGVKRKQSFIVSAQEVEQASALAYQQAITDGTKRGAVNQDQRKTERVRAIANRLIPQTAVFRPDAAKWAWQENVLTDPSVNAYCMAGGKIMVFTGLIDKLNPTDAELAAVIGHEIAHALREHSREAMTNAYVQQLALVGLSAATNASADMVQLAGVVSQVTYTLPHSRDMETEADRIGIELMARAGYDPHAAVTLFEKMGKATGNNMPAFLSSHPLSADRAKNLERAIPRVMPLYEAIAKR